MKKQMHIGGMMCAHCKGHIENALEMVSDVKADVDPEHECAYISCNVPVSNETLKKAVEDAGYEVGAITDLE